MRAFCGRLAQLSEVKIVFASAFRQLLSVAAIVTAIILAQVLGSSYWYLAALIAVPLALKLATNAAAAKLRVLRTAHPHLLNDNKYVYVRSATWFVRALLDYDNLQLVGVACHPYPNFQSGQRTSLPAAPEVRIRSHSIVLKLLRAALCAINIMAHCPFSAARRTARIIGFFAGIVFYWPASLRIRFTNDAYRYRLRSESPVQSELIRRLFAYIWHTCDLAYMMRLRILFEGERAMPHWFKRAVLAAGCLGSSFLSFTAPAVAQQDAMAELYGQGVHHYYVGDYANAELLLNQVLASGSEDPRVHYFLGLCKVMQGGGIMAGTADFEAGARAEATSRNAYQIGQALQRIQGGVRAEIENARVHARAAVRQQQLAEQRARMQTGVAGTAPASSNLGTPALGTPALGTPALGTAPSATTPATPVPTDDPFGDSGLRSDTATIDPIQPIAPDTSNPFGDDPSAPAVPGTVAPATAPDATDPFSTPPAAGMSDPFGTSN